MLRKKSFLTLVCMLILFLALGLSACTNNVRYNKEIDKRFEQVEDKLRSRLVRDTSYEDLINSEVTYLKFNEPSEEDVDLQVFYKGVNDTTGELMRSYIVYKVLIDDYNSLIKAEESGNVLTYLESLEEIFIKMHYKTDDSHIDIPCKLPEVTGENVNKFHEIFALNDVENDDVVRQVGFLPYNVELVEYDFDKEKQEVKYTYKIFGISYCETKSESSDIVKTSEDLIINKKYDKKHIKAFNREMTFTTTTIQNIGHISENRLAGDIHKIIEGVNNPYAVETTLFSEINITKLFEEIRLNKTKFEMPQEFDLDGYIEERKVTEENSRKEKIMVQFLNVTFATFDSGIFNAMHNLAKSAGSIFTPFFKIITLLGEKGLIFFGAAVIMMLFAKTRKLGICMFGAVACGAILTNIILKDMIARPRPFEIGNEFEDFWKFVGSPEEEGYSFPSGHMTAIMSAMTAMFIICNKKWSWVGFVGVMFMGISRIYLIAHYATDVIAGIIVGAIAGVIAYIITNFIYRLLNKYSDKKFCDFLLNWSLLKKTEKTEQEQ